MTDWKRTLISPDTTIQKALQIIDESSLQIALVIDGSQRLLGTVTDGDTRRGLLKGIALNQPVSFIMQNQPIIASPIDGPQKILSMMREKTIRQIPVLNENGVVVGLELMDELLRAGERDQWVVLMAGGVGKRLSPITDTLPKPLIQIGKKPILETILENFIDYGFYNFYFAVNYKNQMIKDYFKDGSKWGVRIIYLEEDKMLGTAGALSLLPGRPEKTFLVMNGDLLTKVNFTHLFNFHRESNVIATMCVRGYDFQVPYGVVKIDDRYICSIDEKPIQRFFVNAGIYVLDPSVLDFIPKNQQFDMPQLFDALMRSEKSVAAFPIREYWLDIGRMDDLVRAQVDIMNFTNRKPEGNGHR